MQNVVLFSAPVHILGSYYPYNEGMENAFRNKWTLGNCHRKRTDEMAKYWFEDEYECHNEW